ncbi:MAG: DUF177 domain-containing protein [Pacificimonas sp.]
MSGIGFSRTVRLDEIGGGIQRRIEASEIERAALAKRFDLLSVSELTANFRLESRAAGIQVSGNIVATAIAPCAVSAEPVPQTIDEEVAVLVVPDVQRSADEEIELSEGELDVVLLQGGKIDLGEIAADSLALALDPYPLADEETLATARRLLISEEEADARRLAGKRAASPFAALQGTTQVRGEGKE